MYNSVSLSKIFGLSRESICKYLNRGVIPASFDGYRYIVSEEQLFDLLDSSNRMLYLLQENSTLRAKTILEKYKRLRNYERIYHVEDLAMLCGMSVSWARSLKDRGKISGTYIKESEFLEYLKHHEKHVHTLQRKVCNFQHYEVLRVYILSRLQRRS